MRLLIGALLGVWLAIGAVAAIVVIAKLDDNPTLEVRTHHITRVLDDKAKTGSSTHDRYHAIVEGTGPVGMKLSLNVPEAATAEATSSGAAASDKPGAPDGSTPSDDKSGGETTDDPPEKPDDGKTTDKEPGENGDQGEEAATPEAPTGEAPLAASTAGGDDTGTLALLFAFLTVLTLVLAGLMTRIVPALGGDRRAQPGALDLTAATTVALEAAIRAARAAAAGGEDAEAAALAGLYARHAGSAARDATNALLAIEDTKAARAAAVAADKAIREGDKATIASRAGGQHPREAAETAATAARAAADATADALLKQQSATTVTADPAKNPPDEPPAATPPLAKPSPGTDAQ